MAPRRAPAQPPPSAGASGYSATPLARKLGIKAGTRLYTEAAPADYRTLLAPLPPQVRFVKRLDATTDLVHLFARDCASLALRLAALRRALRPDAVIWVSWPKRASGARTDLSEHAVRAAALPLQLVDVKVCAVDAVWSGLKLMVRREARPGAR